MSPAPGYCIDWNAGPTAQIEVSSPGSEPNAGYKLKFTPPFRSTLRQQSTLKLNARTLDKYRADLENLFVAVDARAGPGGANPATDDQIIAKTKMYGGQLLSSVVPAGVQAELKGSKELYLEFGIDEPLIEFLWELLHDRTEFLCLKHRVGRFVNVTRQATPPVAPPDPWSEGPLSVLIISVPIPQQRRNMPAFTELRGARAETDKIVDIISNLGPAAKPPHVLRDANATRSNVWEALTGEERYHIIHYSGHAYFDPNDPTNSSLVLFDQDMEAGDIHNYLVQKPPVLSFMNGCETASTPGGNRYDIFNLARAFLDTGSYLVGNRWRVGDKAAAAFAETFYKDLVAGHPLGQVVRDARIACRKEMPEHDFSWASYIFYGDPRLCFRKLV